MLAIQRIMRNAIRQTTNLLFRPFPQSFLVRKPYAGAFLFFVFLFAFVLIYRPLNVSESELFNFSLTILAYCAFVAIVELILAIFISRTNCFFPKGNWAIANELLSIFILLTGIGISVYFAGFLMEPAGSRWNLATFQDSFFRAILIGLIPVSLPSLLNVRYAFAQETFKSYKVEDKKTDNQEILINIESKAKKEHLEFYPNELIYAESKGNYVDFHLIKQNSPVSVTIRNSISEIESQLSAFPNLMRTHRAFLVNLNKIKSKKGNALGYRLALKDCSDIVPVSRQNVQKFEQMMGQEEISVYH